MVQNLFKKPFQIFIFCVLAFISFGAKAGEPPFGFIYTTDLNPKGTYEFEQKVNYQRGQAHGIYNNFEIQSEFEYGVTNDFQAAFYLNYDYIAAKNNDARGKTTSNKIPAQHNPNESYRALLYRGISTEFIYRILSPYKDSFGLAFYVQPSYGSQEIGLENKIIIHKNFLDDRLVLASNINLEYEKERQGAVFGSQAGDTDFSSGWSKETHLDFLFGASYRFFSNWSFGWEHRLHNDFDGHKIARSKHTQIVNFTGPAIHYGGKNFFATLSVLKQVSAKALTSDEKQNYVGDKIYGDHANYDGIRLIIGIPFQTN